MEVVSKLSIFSEIKFRLKTSISEKIFNFFGKNANFRTKFDFLEKMLNFGTTSVFVENSLIFGRT